MISRTSVIKGGTRHAVVKSQLVLGMSGTRLGVRQSLWTGTVHQVVICKVVGGAMQRAANSRRRLCMHIHQQLTFTFKYQYM